MQKTTAAMTILCLTLSACAAPDMQASKSKESVFEYKRMKSGQDRFDVGVHPSRTWVRIVPISSRVNVTEDLLTSMASEVSGCPAHLKGEVLHTIPNYTPELAFPLSYPIRVELNC